MTVVAIGAVVPEAVEAVRFLASEEVAANLVVVTSADRLAAELTAGAWRHARASRDACRTSRRSSRRRPPRSRS